jgi:acetylornithine deacetylase/succinyl-diaminopimelate desuccinylase-like protein
MLRRVLFSLSLALLAGHPARAAETCTQAAGRAADTLRQAGFADAQIVPFAAPDHPDAGGLVATWPGKAKADDALLLVDDAAGPGDFVAAMARLAHGRARLRRTVKLALTCGNADWLIANRRDLIGAAVAFGAADGPGLTVVDGKPAAQAIVVATKTALRFTLDTHNRGGRSALPRPDNAIYQLAHALDRIEATSFPVEFTPVTSAYFRMVGAARGDVLGHAMAALAADPADRKALWQVDTDAFAHANIRTTCVATRVEGGDGTGLPQTARATLDCRVIPGHDPEEIRRRIETMVGDPEVVVTLLPVAPATHEDATWATTALKGAGPLVPAMANEPFEASAFAAAGILVVGVANPADGASLDRLIRSYAF